jgi:hypothetical protein
VGKTNLRGFVAGYDKRTKRKDEDASTTTKKIEVNGRNRS